MMTSEVTLTTVTGPVPVHTVTLADAHAHAWIDPPAGVSPEARVELRDEEGIRAELAAFHAAGGTTLIDCQPGGCGRNARKLVVLSRASGLHITATTGFHRQCYYPPGHWLWSARAEDAASWFVRELTVGLEETIPPTPLRKGGSAEGESHGGGVRAATIKVGYEGAIEGQTRVLMEAAAEASRHTGAAILFHTERGRNVEALLPFFAEKGVPPDRLYLCHVDKRPDLALHRVLAQAGVLLGYDTFVRPKYRPDEGAWRLLETLVADGLEQHIAIGLDLADATMWQRMGEGPGPRALSETILPRLRDMSLGDTTIANLTGQNVARFLAHP